MKTAKNNSDLYEQVFGGKAIPTNAAKNFKELNEFRVSEKMLMSHNSDICVVCTIEPFIQLPKLLFTCCIEVLICSFVYNMHAQLQCFLEGLLHFYATLVIEHCWVEYTVLVLSVFVLI